MVRAHADHLVFKNSTLELSIEFSSSESKKTGYQIVSQRIIPFDNTLETTSRDSNIPVKFETILKDLFSQDIIDKYYIITNKNLTVEETIFLPSMEEYLDIKIIPQAENKAKLELVFHKLNHSIIESDLSSRKQKEHIRKELSDSTLLVASNNHQRTKSGEKIIAESSQLKDISNFKLNDLIDLKELNNLMKIFHEFNNIPIIIVDLEGKILTSINMTEICTKFHRINKISQSRCMKSDINLTKDLKKDEIRFYKCYNNMYDLVSPIYVGDNHIANFFVGEFFFTDEEIDYEHFKQQAKELGFNEEDYLSALTKVPCIERDKVMLIISFYRDLIKIITTLAHSRLKLIELNSEIEQREEKLQQITNNMTDVVITSDFDYNIKYVSPSIEKLTGYTPEEYKQLTMEERYPPKAIKEIRESLALELNQDKWSTDKNRTNINVLVLYNKHGRLVYTSIHSKFIRDKNNKPIAIIANISNITQQKRAEFQLDKQVELQNIMRTITAKYINISTIDIHSSLNESLAQMAKFVKADRAYIFEYFWDKQTCTLSYEWVAPEITPHIDDLQNFPLEDLSFLPQEHKAGKTVHIDDFTKIDKTSEILSQITIPIISDKKCFGFVGFDSVKHKNFFKESDVTMLSIFAELIVNITNRVTLENELRDERKKAQDSDDLKSNLLKNISHEFRTPLNGIVGFSELLQLKSSDYETGNMASMIYSSAVRLNHVLDSIMLLTQIEDLNKKKNIILRTSNISTILLEISSLFKDQFTEKGLTFISEIEANLFGKIESKLLYQALIHLLNNALKFTQKGGVKLIGTSQDNKIIIKIIDSGVGIPNESLNIIFSEFRQASEGYNRSYEGVGLGLTIAKKIVDIMQGDISVDSKILEGSTFTISLPKSVNDDMLDGELKLTDETVIIKTDIHKPKILIVEDNTINQKLIISILKDDFSTDLAVNGEVAVLLTEKKKYDAILMDIHLGQGIDGLAAARVIKESSKNLTTPIIAVTGYTLYGDKEKILAEGCNYYLGKPYKKQELLEVINKAITEH